MDHETQLIDLSDEELVEIKSQIEAWKDEYEDVYITEFDDENAFIWRCLTRKEFNKAMAYFDDEFDRAEYVCRVCVLDPTEIDYSDDMIAGIPEVLTENILRSSGFSDDSAEMEYHMKTFENEMNLFSNQIACVIVEAYPTLTLEDVEGWNLRKTLWHYSRAKWSLQVLRGVELKRDDNAVGNAAPDGTMVSGDPKDFPELMR